MLLPARTTGLLRTLTSWRSVDDLSIARTMCGTMAGVWNNNQRLEQHYERNTIQKLRTQLNTQIALTQKRKHFVRSNAQRYTSFRIARFGAQLFLLQPFFSLE